MSHLLGNSLLIVLAFFAIGCSHGMQRQTSGAVARPNVASNSSNPLVLAETNLIVHATRYSNELSFAAISADQRNLVPLACVGDLKQQITLRTARELLDRNAIEHTTYPGTGGAIVIIVRKNDFQKGKALLAQNPELKGKDMQIAE